MAKNKKNYLDFVPVRSALNEWEAAQDGIVTIHMVHRGPYALIAQKLFKRPRISHIELDGVGSFIFSNIDGERTVGDIANMVHEQFGEKADPLYDRLVTYMKILRNNGFITYKK